MKGNGIQEFGRTDSLFLSLLSGMLLGDREREREREREIETKWEVN